MKLVSIGDTELVVANVGGRFYAFGSECTHMGGDMVDGLLDALTVECPLHDSRYDIRSGKLLHGPGYGPLPVYEVREVNGEVQIALS